MSPYKSDAQRRYFNANRAKLERQGVDVDEWNQASEGRDVPEKAHHEKRRFRQRAGFYTHTKGTL